MKNLPFRHFHHWLLAAFVVSMIACSYGSKNEPVQNISTDNDRIGLFWTWFDANKSQFEVDTDVQPPPDLDPIFAELAKVSDGLSVEVSREINGVRDLVISANGDKSKFQMVQNVVNRAPAIKGWTITPFRQRANKDFVLETPSLRLATDEMYFEPLKSDNEIELIIYSKDIKDLDKDVVKHFGLIVLDNVLGEYDSVMKVRNVDFQELPHAPDRLNLQPLSKLPQFVDDFFSKKNN